VWYQLFDGASWSGPTTLSGANATRPDIAADANLAVHIVYEEAAEATIRYRKRTPDGAWTAPVNLKSGGRSIAPAIACNTTGDRIIAAWHEDYQVGGEWDILVNVFDGTGWSGAVNISNDSAVSTYPKVAVDAAGNMHVAWSSGADILYRKRDVTGAWGPKVTVRHTPTRVGLNSLTTTSDGLVLCLFAEDDTQGWEVFSTYYNGAAWSTPLNVSNRPGASDDIDGSIHVDGYDRLFAVWHDYSGIYYSAAPTYSSLWSAPQAIVSGKYLATVPDVVIDSGLTARVVWQSRPTQNDNWNIYVSSQSVGSPGPHGTIAGTVRDQHGYAIAGVLVTAGVYQIGTNVDGMYALTRVATGTYSVSAAKSCFAGQTVVGVIVLEGQTTTVDLVLTALPPDPVSSFAVTSLDRTNTLRWQNPGSTSFAGTRIRYGTTGYPAGPTDGMLVVDEPGTPSAWQSYEHRDLIAGQTYYYAAFAYDDRPVPTYAAGANASAVPPGPADFDGDGDTDMSDFALFQLCFNGPNRPAALGQGCEKPDTDTDHDVDLADFAVFQGCFNGPNRPPALGCGP